MANKFAIVTGGSTGIGAELVKLAVQDGYDVLTAADTPFEQDFGAGVETLDVDLSTLEGVDTLLAAAGGRQIDLLCANAGHGLGHAFLDQKVEDWRHVIDTNITGTIYLLHKVLPAMVARNEGKVLVTGSIAGYIPGSFQAVYNSSKSFVDFFCDAIRNELKESDGVQITTLKPGPVDTEFFARGDMLDTSVGDPNADNKRDPALVAKDGWDALMSGKDSIFSGWSTKVQGAMAGVTPAAVLAERHRGMAEPGSAEKND
jgi:short-subunit dehydrogenase